MSQEPGLLERYIGTILGVACGDALGAPVEGWSKGTISKVLGSIRGYQLTMMGKGIYTDDTQLTLLLIRSILSRRTFEPSDYAYEIGDWMRRCDEGIESARGVGKTVSMAARRLYRGIPWTKSGENSPSNGAAVRIAPLVLLHYKSDDLEKMMKDIENCSRPTHIEPLAIQGAKLLAFALFLILKEDRYFFDRIRFLDALAKGAETYAPNMIGSLEMLKKLCKGKPLEDTIFPPLKDMSAIPSFHVSRGENDCQTFVEEIGTGKYVLESIPAALCCFLFSPTHFEETLLNAVNAGGDTDSIAAMAGMLSGALNGASAIPMRWLLELENKDEILNMTIRLHDMVMGLDMEEPAGIAYFQYVGIRLMTKS